MGFLKWLFIKTLKGQTVPYKHIFLAGSVGLGAMEVMNHGQAGFPHGAAIAGSLGGLTIATAFYAID